MPNVLDEISKVLKTAQTITPLISAFVPGSRSVTDAVNRIHLDGGRSNDDAVQLLAAALDQQEKRIKAVEKAVRELKKK